MAAFSRRQMLALTGGTSVAGLAGCVDMTDSEDDDADRRDPDWCVEQYDVEIPDEERTAESIDGIQRDPEELSPRDEVGYQCHPQGFQLCANCRYWIPAQTLSEETIGACAIVEGRVRSQDWCGLYDHTEQLDERPNGDPIG